MSDKLLRQSVTKAILSGKFPEFADKLRNFGYQIIPSETVSCFINYERDHADMQCLIIEDTAFVLSCCQRLAKSLENDYKIVHCGDNITGKYPNNIPLNACVIEKTLIGRLDSVDKKVLDFCLKRGYQLINVRQGYTKCSCVVVSDHTLITADNGIFNSLNEINIEVLKVEEGRVRLSETTNGFLGGASGYYDHKIYFTGNIQLHPDYQRIKEFCDKHNTKMISLTDGPLRDIGGIIFC